MIDLEKRKRVMGRSMKLGHCVCNVRQSCPCDLFKQEDVCTCAGERREDTRQQTPLTQLVERAGCASKISQNDLKRILIGLPQMSDPRLLVGSNTCDDAGVYLLQDDLALVHTVDVFTPGVDDPYVFGQIAAANSLSDVYAMGGQALTALAIIGFPIEQLSHATMAGILRGGLDKMIEAGVTVVGGHSINDLDVKFGFAVTGTVHPDRIITNSRARPGDLLVLTKPLGVGVISFARQLERASEQALAAISESMTALNKAAAEVMVEAGVRCATDVTGFGLLGHLTEMVCQSGVAARIYVDQVPVFPEALDYLRQGMIPGATERNRESAGPYVTIEGAVPEELTELLYDPQTSGGLLMAVPQAEAEDLRRRLHEAGVAAAEIVGEVFEAEQPGVIVSCQGATPFSCAERVATTVTEDEPCCCGGGEEPDTEEAPPCCAEPPAEPCCAAAGPAVAAGMQEAFGQFMGQVFGPGELSRREKELIAIALSVASRCEPCVKIHRDQGLAAGLSEAEIEEAAWMGVSFGGAPAMMFYRASKGK